MQTANQKQIDFIRKTAAGIAILSSREQMILIDMVFENIDDLQKMKWFERISHLVYPDSRWVEIEQWMEKRFMKDLSRTPRQVASMCTNYMRINRRMAPLMIKLAQKVKARVVMREKRGVKQNIRGQ